MLTSAKRFFRGGRPFQCSKIQILRFELNRLLIGHKKQKKWSSSSQPFSSGMLHNKPNPNLNTDPNPNPNPNREPNPKDQAKPKLFASASGLNVRNAMTTKMSNKKEK